MATQKGSSHAGYASCTRAERLQAALERTKTRDDAAKRTPEEPRLVASSSTSSNDLTDLPSSFAAAPRGYFDSAVAPSHESLRDFARIALSTERRLFIMTRGMVSMRPLHIVGESLDHNVVQVGEFNSTLSERVCAEMQEALSQRLVSAGCLPLDEPSLVLLRENVVRSMSASVGINFTVRTGLVPTFLQPLYVLVLMGGAAGGAAMQAHLLVYGFVAGRMDHVISSDLDVKCTPFCACLMSPNLLDSALACEEGALRSWEYSVRRVSKCNIREAAERDAQLLRQAVKLGRLEFQSDCPESSGALVVGKDAKQIDGDSTRLQPHPEAVKTRPALPRSRAVEKAPMSMFSSFWSQTPWSQPQGGLPSMLSNNSHGPLHELSRQLAASPSGHFMSKSDVGQESLRNFARVFLAKGHQRKVYVMARGMVSMKPLQLSGAVDIGDVDSETICQAQTMFADTLGQWIEAVGAPKSVLGNRDGLCAAVAASMSGCVGIDFSQHVGLLPMFTQPMFLLLILAGHADTQPQVRMLVYGFVAGDLGQVCSGRAESKSTPFCARLTSPDLLGLHRGPADDACEWEYTVYRVRTTSIREAAERDAARLREAVGSGRW